jgi:RecA/RadA recombinase
MSVRSRLRRREPEIRRRRYLSTGSTLLDLGCSGQTRGGFPSGSYVLLVGDSASGKTFLAMTCFAEATQSRFFGKHRLILNDSEGGAQMDVRKFFGAAVAERLEVRQPRTVEEFWDSVDDDLEDGRPFIQVLDSMDALDSEADDEKIREQKRDRRKGKEITGSMGTAKARQNSSRIRRAVGRLRRSESVLVVVSQTRDSIGPMAGKSRSGGRALRFFADLELWTAIRQKITRTVLGKTRQVGIVCEVRIKKNRLQGREPTVELPIYYSHGFDDVGGCVAYLDSEGHWESANGRVHAPEFRFRGPPEKLIQKIEAEGRERELRDIVESVWREIEEKSRVNRKPRYV